MGVPNAQGHQDADLDSFWICRAYLRNRSFSRSNLQFESHQTIVSDCSKLQFELHWQPAVRGGGSNPRVCMWHCALSYINPTWKSRCPAFLGQFWELDLHTLRWVSHGFQLHPNRQLPTAWGPAICGSKLQFGAAPVPCATGSFWTAKLRF